MAFTGTYKQESCENFEPFMKAIKIPDDVIKQEAEVKSETEIVQDGNKFTIKVTTGTRVLTNEFTVGEEAELTHPTGEKFKGTFNMEDGKLVLQAKGTHTVIEISGEKLLTTMTYKGIEYKRISVKSS